MNDTYMSQMCLMLWCLDWAVRANGDHVRLGGAGELGFLVQRFAICACESVHTRTNWDTQKRWRAMRERLSIER